MKRALGEALFNLTVWQQDRAKPHQANMVMDWLDSIFEERMLAIKSRRGETRPPPLLISDVFLCVLTTDFS